MNKCNPVNHNRLDPKMCFITYESSQMITDLCEPRKYTILKLGDKIHISIGHDYDRELIKLDKLQHRVIGKWDKKDRKYQLRFTVLLSTQRYPDCEDRSEYWCENFGEYLEAVGHAEAGLLKVHNNLLDSEVLVYFKSHDEDYDHIEHWNKLGYWADGSEYEDYEQDYNSGFSFRKTETSSKFSKVRKSPERSKNLKIDLSAMYENKRPSLMDIKMTRKMREESAKNTLVAELSDNIRPINRNDDGGLKNEIGYYDSRVFSESILPPNKNKMKKDDYRGKKAVIRDVKEFDESRSNKIINKPKKVVVEDEDEDSSINIDQKEFLKMKNNAAKKIAPINSRKGDCATCR